MGEQIGVRDHLHENDLRAFSFIIQYKKDNDGISPTCREIGDAISVSSTSVIYSMLRRLESLGFITVWDEQARGIKVIGGKRTYGGGGDV